jgi:hypothetical protein
MGAERLHDEGARDETWFVPGVRKVHRTIATMMNGLVDAGLTIERVAEPIPSAEWLDRHPSGEGRDMCWHFPQEEFDVGTHAQQPVQHLGSGRSLPIWITPQGLRFDATVVTSPRGAPDPERFHPIAQGARSEPQALRGLPGTFDHPVAALEDFHDMGALALTQ